MAIHDGEITLSDAVEGLKTLQDQSVDLILTDPPYSSLEKWRAIGTTTRLKESKSSSNAWFPVVPDSYFDEFFVQCFRVLKKDTHIYVMCDPDSYLEIHPRMKAAGFEMKKPLIWEKVGHPKLTYCPRCRTPLKEEAGLGSPGMGYPYRSSYEMIAFGQKGNRGVPQDRNVRDVLRFPKVKHKDAYPTEKPVELLQVMIKQSSLPGDIVLDPFAGSGSTLMAAQRSGRKSLGFDISRDAISHYLRNNFTFQLSVPWFI